MRLEDCRLRACRKWAGQSCFGVRIMTDHEDCPEMAEVYKHDKMSPLWFLNATQDGTAVLTKASGRDQEFGTLEEALAEMLRLERPVPDAARPPRARVQRGWHHPMRRDGP